MAYNKSNSDSDFTKEILESFGSVSNPEDKGWAIELNLVKWGTYSPKYDLRPWSPDHEKCGKGIGLTLDQLKNLRELLNNMNLD